MYGTVVLEERMTNDGHQAQCQMLQALLSPSALVLNFPYK